MKDLLNFFDKPKDPVSVEAVSVRMASPDTIREWSFGEVKKPETINYRTFKPERDGLFCAKIFGPVKDYECICGKYKRMKHRGVVCEKCGVEVTLSKVRRERMGHIELATPVAHIWFLRSLPSRLGALLDLSLKDLEKVLYYESYLVTDSATNDIDGGLKVGTVISEQQYNELKEQGIEFEASMGGETVKAVLKRIDIDMENKVLRRDLLAATTEMARTKTIKRLKVVESLMKSENKPEWFMMEVVPVLPPDLRPLVPLDAGRFATSDLNDLYRRVINRNNRLKRLKELNAPEIIIRNEKRMLQEAVDALFDNGRRGKVFTGANKRPLRSLSDMLKGKQGRFRQNLLGKRVDYSGRSVIVVGPSLRLHQCGLPKLMALELFKPFIYNKLIEKGHCTTIKVAKRMVDQQKEEVWNILEEVVQEHPVLLNRAPTLHRLGIQGFEPTLIEGKAIQLHPLVCTAFNADFDGDQMAVHVPLSLEAQIECRVLAMSTNNILSPKDGTPIIVPSQDIVLGLYYMTRIRPFAKGYGKVFSSREEAQFAYHTGNLHLQSPITVRINGELVETTVGRTFVLDVIPSCLKFSDVNIVLSKKAIGKLIDKAYRVGTEKDTVLLADSLMRLGYANATKAGISINVNDMTIPEEKPAILGEAYKEVDKIMEEYNDGSITNGERYNKVVDVWTQTNERLTKVLLERISTDTFTNEKGAVEKAPSFNAIFMMADSGARGSTQQIRQLGGMRGLMAKPSGEIIETPITSNFREGLTVLQYFSSTHGARKGLADTALKTANSGYLTRRLVDVAQDGIIRNTDCGARDGIILHSRVEGGDVVEHVSERVMGRVTASPVVNAEGTEVLPRNHMFTEGDMETLKEHDIDQIKVRSVLTCQERHGFCAFCFGRDLARGTLVSLGETVGIIAAQSIGEPGTQLTMRTFHVGGTATAGAQVNKTETRTAGVIQLQNIVTAKTPAGDNVVMTKNGEVIIKDNRGVEKERYPAVYGSKIFYTEGQEVNVGDKILEWDPFSIPLLTEVTGFIKFEDIIPGASVSEQVDTVTGLTTRTVIESKDPSIQPRISVLDKDGKPIVVPGTKRHATYRLQIGANIIVADGDEIGAGMPLSKVARETTKTKDITGGLPRVAELFEARKPSNAAQIADISGNIEFGPELRGSRRIIIRPEDGSDSVTYTVPKGRFVVVNEGDYIRAGEPIMDGPSNPHDILRVMGVKALARYIVDEIQEVYRLQGVKIDDKHIEVIVSQMLKKVEIMNAGDSTLIVGDSITKSELAVINDDLIARDLKPAEARPLLLGITKASLTTESFLSAASFQETTKVLTQASLEGKKDQLRGLKENVLMGRLIPAGTGIAKYRDFDAATPGDEAEASADGVAISF
ncbi:MAG: DNA-directed RNA polymerase subunit beta' [Bdellovibrio sp. CG12_big_fil_rev_8_21_14_0_65_39_13]|nr:MAG: DNA-directed RNA polymerase subunit beta' [Bdellovibrio sp. CG22_combo_CG10-13_8_21_14_all_39_27]PIQ59215.1 MAG: DNA-directed RNA polymerase subunit beta' [Bdellovibrio sp. CG12_big_fil_rev_8_21_14_0_65_39_13]PIR37016.1 MAG: DNA-directed RNA polymerase subunit beta' [Bdellovibrio sp. CG11_big_fil_rev_8_21_14_0_20_39_38]